MEYFERVIGLEPIYLRGYTPMYICSPERLRSVVYAMKAHRSPINLQDQFCESDRTRTYLP